MIHFFGNAKNKVYAVQTSRPLDSEQVEKLKWLFGNQPLLSESAITPSGAAHFLGMRAAMISPWSTGAVEITQNMNIEGILRIEEYQNENHSDFSFDPLLHEKFSKLDQTLFKTDSVAEGILEVDNISEYNQKHGLAMNEEEVAYLEKLSEKLNRKLTDSEVFGFSQVNSEHCRHKIFNGIFEIDGVQMPDSLFDLIKKTSAVNPNYIVSAYKDNVAFIKGPRVKQWAPKSGDKADWFEEQDFDSVISLKAETHNYPTTVEPFNGAATGTGGEIRDRLAGGKGSLPLAGTAVYMTSYSRLEKNRPWEKNMEERQWLYQTPLDILIKASLGASDFGNKFGQPLITGSVLTFEHEEDARKLGFDKVIMLAGGIGYGKADQALKGTPAPGDRILVLGGDNYRIGMGGAAVSSADTGEIDKGIEYNAIQRSNPEMQKRAANTIRAMVESKKNPIVSIHDHGAGGHLNCLSELVEDTGGQIDLEKLPVGDPTLSDKEIMGNESQERMGLIAAEKDLDILRRVAQRERAPLYEVGEVSDDKRFYFINKSGKKPLDFELDDLFGSSPTTIMQDRNVPRKYSDPQYDSSKINKYVSKLLQLEAVACKDWLTNKADRSAGGLVAKQQTAGPLQLPLNNCGVMALDYTGKEGVATSIGHAPVSALIDPVAGSRNSIAEALTNIIWAPLKNGLQSVSLSANWMWPCNNEGEDARLYQAVKAVSDFAIELGINVPTGKDSLSMKQVYKNEEVIAPGTVIISAAAPCKDVKKTVEPVLKKNGGSLYYINLSQDNYKLGGSSFNQILCAVGSQAPTVKSASYLKTVFNTIQSLISEGKILAGHDVSSGGLITTLLEMCFADLGLGASINLSSIEEDDLVKILFSENAGIVFQAADDIRIEEVLSSNAITYKKIGHVTDDELLQITHHKQQLLFHIPEMRDIWYHTSYLLDSHQSGSRCARERFDNYKNQALQFKFPENFLGRFPVLPKGKRIRAAVIREKGSSGEREASYMLHAAGFDVKDIHMTDLIQGDEDLKDIQFLVASGGFSNSDILGGGKGWAAGFLFNPKAKKALEDFFEREDTLSLGINNGCQLFLELGLIHPEDEEKPRLEVNKSKKFESVFTTVKIQKNPSVMLSSLAGSTLGIWAAHSEGRFRFPKGETDYNIVAKYAFSKLPSNPNGSDFNAAMVCDKTGRHLVMMPQMDRSAFPWNWACYPEDRINDKVSPWLEAFVNARNWLTEKNKII